MPGCVSLSQRLRSPTRRRGRRSATPTPWPGAGPPCWNRSPSSRRPKTSSSTASRSADPRPKERPTLAVRVVIAEDEAIIRLDLKEILEEEGYEVVGETGRGDEAITLVREHTPDLVILDIRMPGVDGLAAAREITADGDSAVLILTAFSQRNLIEEARDAGVMAYLIKPFTKTELIPAIEVARGRFEETKAIKSENASLTDQLEARRQ